MRNIARGFRSLNQSFVLIAGLAVVGMSCKPSSETDVMGNWTRGSDFEGVARSGAAGFVIGNNAYVGTGINSRGERLKDFWQYDSQRNTWTQKAEFPGEARQYASGFAANNLGYIGIGQNLSGQPLRDFYSYDATANTWKKIADYMGSGRYLAVAFTINNVGYVGTGYDGNFLNDIYSFNGTAWTKETSYAGTKRLGASAMVINNKAYVGTGSNNGSKQRDWWEYDPGTKIWTQKADFTTDQASIARNYASTFVIGNIGYLAFGDTDAHLWSYDPASDIWTDVQDISSNNYKVPVTNRRDAFGFSIGTKGYITTGVNGSQRLDDIHVFDPAAVRVLVD